MIPVSPYFQSATVADTAKSWVALRPLRNHQPSSPPVWAELADQGARGRADDGVDGDDGLVGGRGDVR